VARSLMDTPRGKESRADEPTVDKRRLWAPDYGLRVCDWQAAIGQAQLGQGPRFHPVLGTRLAAKSLMRCLDAIGVSVQQLPHA
jgi:hypothetical protein